RCRSRSKSIHSTARGFVPSRKNVLDTHCLLKAYDGGKRCQMSEVHKHCVSHLKKRVHSCCFSSSNFGEPFLRATNFGAATRSRVRVRSAASRSRLARMS